MAGMPASLPAALNDGDDQFAIAVAEGDLRTQEVGPADVTAAEVRAVAAGATDAVERLAARDLHGVAGRPLLARHEASGAASARCCSSASGLAGRRCFLRRETRRHGKRQSKQSSDHLDPHRLPLKKPIYECAASLPVASGRSAGANLCIVRLFGRAVQRRWSGRTLAAKCETMLTIATHQEAYMGATSRREFFRRAAADTAVAGFISAGARVLGAAPLGMPIGCQTYPVRAMIGQDFPGTIKQLADAGFQSVELCSPVGYASSGFGSIAKYKGAELRKILGDLGVKCESSHFDMKELRENLAGRIEWAKDAGLTQMLVPSLGWTAKADDGRREACGRRVQQNGRAVGQGRYPTGPSQ